MIHCKYDELVSINSLKAYPKNRNKHPEEQIARLAQILRYQGIRAPIIVDESDRKTIVKGHGTKEAAWVAGFKEVPVVYQKFDTEEQRYAFVQSDNAIANWAELDLSGINADVGDLGPDFDLDLLGIKDFELEPADKYGDKDADAIPEIRETSIKTGDLFQLGSHRLLCADSTIGANVERLMNGEKADMVFTDPPYGMNLDTDYSSMGNTGLKHRKVIGDGDDFDLNLINTIFENFGYVEEMFLWGMDYYAQLISGRNKGSVIVWDKRSDKGNVALLDGQFGSAFELVWSKNKHKREICRELGPRGFYESDGNEKQVHPTQKPIRVIDWFFDRWGKDTKLVVDLYLGSGSTLIACEKTNRKCYGMEIDPQYCQVIIDRWEKFTGEKAKKIT